MVPRHLSELEDGVSVGADDEDRDDEYPTVVVCSGELVEQVRIIGGSVYNNQSHANEGIPSPQLWQDHLHVLAEYSSFRATRLMDGGPIPYAANTG